MSADTLGVRWRKAPSFADRITQIYSDSLEETVKNLLQSLGKVNRPYLTAVEEKLLSVIEKEYGIIDEIPPNA